MRTGRASPEKTWASNEAAYQTAERPKLCIGLDEALLTRFDLAVIGPQGSPWIQKISAWLADG